MRGGCRCGDGVEETWRGEMCTRKIIGVGRGVLDGVTAGEEERQDAKLDGQSVKKLNSFKTAIRGDLI